MSMRGLFKFLYIIIILFSTLFAKSQCDSTFLGNDLFLCKGQAIILDAGEGYLSYQWNTGSTGQYITVSDTGTYWCTVELVDSTNQVINGNFNLGNYGFQSDYNYNPSSVYIEGTYAVTTSPTFVHPDFAGCTDHTSGSGNMMVVNGASIANQNVWFESIPVEPNTDYHYSGWFTSVHPSNPAVLQLSINGMPIQEINLESATCIWQNFYSVWNSGANNFIELQIVNQNTAFSGNDFAIDDINLFQVCILTDSLHVSFAPNPHPNLGNDTTFCDGDSLFIFPGNFNSYEWQDGSTEPFYVIKESGLYWVSVTNSYGCFGGDSVNVEVIPVPDIELGNDTTICEGQFMVLNPGAGFLSYVWQDNSTASTFTVTDPGTYWVTVYNDELCPVSDTILVNEAPWPNVNLGPDTTACEGEPFILNAGPGYVSYTWQDNSTGTTYPATQTGLYWVTVANDCNEDTDSVYITFKPEPQPDLGPDTTICEGVNFTLETTANYTSYLWQDGSTLPFMDVITAGLYTLEVTDAFGCSNTAEVYVAISSAQVDLGDDILQCNGDTVFLDAGDNYLAYQWQDGYGGSVYAATQSGNYSVNVTDQFNCNASGSVMVEFVEPPVVNLGPDETFCIGDSLILQAPIGSYTYYWNGMQGGNTLMVNQTGTYSLSLVNPCDSVSDEIYISEVSIPEVNLGDDQLAFPGDIVVLDAGSGYDSYLWQNGATGQQLEVTESTVTPGNIYNVEVTLGPCQSSDSVIVEFFEVWVPIVITPNDDGLNDVFAPDLSKWEGIRKSHMMVFNRWGEKVWESDQFENGWDGRKDGTIVADGTYFWILDVTYGDANLHKVLKGSLTVLKSE
mgnify:CR=1 FL=1